MIITSFTNKFVLKNYIIDFFVNSLYTISIVKYSKPIHYSHWYDCNKKDI